MWLHSLKVAQLLRIAACLHTNQSGSYLNHLVQKACSYGGISGYPIFCLIGVKDIHKNNSFDVLQESVDIDDMDEEEGRRLNKALSEAFSMLRGSKTNKKSKKQLNDDRILMHFRIRAIDLLEVYLKSDHVGTEASLLTYIDIMLVLFSLLEFCIRDVHQKPLENRVR